MSERYLANENFPAAIVRWLREQGDDVAHAAETLAGVSDEVVLRVALEQDRILLTFDRDFGQLVFQQRRPPAPGVVVFRLAQQSPAATLSFLRAFFLSQPTVRGFFTVVSPGLFRQVPLAPR